MKNPAFLAFITLMVVAVGFPVSYAKDQPALRTDHPDSYTVVRGDTLWDISGRFLQDPWRWPEIWKKNPRIENPDLIYPGDVIHLIFIEGKPQLTVDGTASLRNDRSTTYLSGELPTVKLSPKIRQTPIKTSIIAIPLEKIHKYLSRNRVVDVSALTQAPHVVAGQEKRIIMGAGDTMYARGNFVDQSASGYIVYRKGLEYKDPQTNELLGFQAVDIAAVSLRAVQDDIGTFTITRSTSEVRVGDYLLPAQERQITSRFLPVSPEHEVDGLIMTVETGVSQAGKYDIVAINTGRKQQVQQGHMLRIFKRGDRIKDRRTSDSVPEWITLPDIQAGLVMVFQVFEDMSLAIILEADRGVTIGDFVRTP